MRKAGSSVLVGLAALLAALPTAMLAADGPYTIGSSTKVLSGIPNYGDFVNLPPDAPRPPLVGDSDHSYQTLPKGADKPILGTNPLGSVPQYVWWYGCSPTSGGMMVGYWDSRPGYQDLYYGDASVWTGDGSSGTRRMVASTAHIVSGQQNGYTYGDWHNSTSYPNHEANPNCLADFFQTVNGGSYSSGITSGLKNYIQWTDPGPNPLKAGYQATTANIDVPYYGGTFAYADLKSQIDQNRPVLLNVLTYAPSPYNQWVGHSIVAYGYRDNMFQIKVPSPQGEFNMTVGGFAVQDTWANGVGQSDWFDWNYNVVYPQFEGPVEWWPFVPLLGSSYTYRWDWLVSDAVTLDVVVPEPGALVLLFAGGGTLAAIWLRRRKPT